HLHPIQFASSKARQLSSLLELLRANAVVAALGLSYVIPVAALFFWMTGRLVPPTPSSLAPSDRIGARYLALLGLWAPATAIGIGLLMNRQLDQGWMEQLWCFGSLYLMAAWRPALDRARLHRLLIGWCALTASWVAVSLAAGVFLVAHGYLFGSQFPG